MVLYQFVVYGLTLYLAWRMLRRFVSRSPLDNIPGPESSSYLTGNLAAIFDRREAWTHQRAIVEQYGRLCTIHGMFNDRWLFTHDPRALHTIFVKEQDVFEESPVLTSSFMLFLGPGLLATLGEQHRRQRKMLNPVFSAKHLRAMMPIFNGVIHKLHDAIAARVKEGPQQLDVLAWMGRAALELIGQGGLGHSFDPLTQDVPDEFAASVKAYFSVSSQLSVPVRQFLPIAIKLGPGSFRRKLVERLPHAITQRMIQICDTLEAQSVKLVNEKKAALAQGDEALKQQVGEGKDIMSVLLRANMNAADEDRLTDEELIAQVSTLVVAAMDTTSNALARIFHQLALHPEVQQKLREEIIRARDDGTGELRDLEYDEVMELPYLDAVCRETLRRYPPVGGLMRVVTKDSVLPLSAPIHGIDGSPIYSVPVKKGMRVLADITGSNCNKELWGEDAFEWRPERWLQPLPRALEEAHIPGVYSHLMTFIGGSRACIGFKFSQLEMKVVLATLIPAFQFDMSDKPIFWNAAGVAYPSTHEESTKPEMPMMVTRIRRPGVLAGTALAQLHAHGRRCRGHSQWVE
ncbi:cytochrome P450 [Trametes coccinea BRFM310]|uniref:Cytochrome P450 n=1 Tax=Trametes coccinea (strain BRFM310) TaxID=1353009 RepID=A0A1Y2IN84_TRAC3|nr:cytochrome P450 [Trametes coccinea BRFM310]